MTWLLSPTEPGLKSELGDRAIISPIPETYGADCFTAVVGRGRIVAQRKTCPYDLLASVTDGRIAEKLPKLLRAEYRFWIVEGWPSFTADGHLMLSHTTRWTKQQIRNLLRSLWFTYGIVVERTDSVQDTATALMEIEDWFRKTVHRSLLTRPKMMVEDTWGNSSKRDFARYLLQTFTGVGVGRAEAIFDHFGKVPLSWTVSEEELTEVQGIGGKLAKSLKQQLS